MDTNEQKRSMAADTPVLEDVECEVDIGDAALDEPYVIEKAALEVLINWWETSYAIQNNVWNEGVLDMHGFTGDQYKQHLEKAGYLSMNAWQQLAFGIHAVVELFGCDSDSVLKKVSELLVSPEKTDALVLKYYGTASEPEPYYKARGKVIMQYHTKQERK
jgi:hypothetical protein